MWPGFQSLWLPAIAHGMISTPTALERWNGPEKKSYFDSDKKRFLPFLKGKSWSGPTELDLLLVPSGAIATVLLSEVAT